MTTPYPQTPGDQREDHAESVAASLAVIFDRIEHALLSALANLARRVAAGSLLPRLAERQLAQMVHVTYASATPQIRTVINRAAAETASAVREVVTQSLGRQAAAPITVAAATPVAEASGPGAVPLLSAPGLENLATSIEQASQNAAASLGQSLAEAVSAAQEVPAPTQTAAAARVAARPLAPAVTRLVAGSPPPAPAAPVPPAPPRPPANIFTPYREGGDAYRQAVQSAIESTRGGLSAQPLSLSRIQAAQKALDDLASRGITGFTDAAGRNWDLVSYVEMATRTAVSNLWDDLYNSALARSGFDLVEIFTRSTEGSCPLCIPWLGKTLSLTGETTGYPTLEEARAAGFRHPNCRCGWTGLGTGEMAEVTNPVPLDEAAAVYKASQRQRALERNVRRAGRRYSVATTPAARTAARRDLAAARAASAAHRQAHSLRITQVGAKRREHPFFAH